MESVEKQDGDALTVHRPLTQNRPQWTCGTHMGGGGRCTQVPSSHSSVPLHASPSSQPGSLVQAAPRRHMPVVRSHTRAPAPGGPASRSPTLASLVTMPPSRLPTDGAHAE